GYRARISGETDFPCIYGERVGLGRSYVRQSGKLDYGDWIEGIREGRNYVSDGKSHLIDFRVNGVRMGDGSSEVRLASPGKVHATADVAALLNEKPSEKPGPAAPYDQKPYWDVERARIAGSNKVPVELVVNGEAIARQEIVADGAMHPVAFDVEIAKSSWVALRILPSSHTNPIFAMIGDRPIRVRKSVEWCLRAVDQCWSQKAPQIRLSERGEAERVYESARAAYRARL
ncbi:MAG: CehA/McbA family metallohydrolase, partial [Acidobacteriota bacterium]|nr:CehA/McbA family metallohydrolase [Acidobacteriota bacterium]